MEQQIERDRRPDDFGEIAGGDRDLAQHPQKNRDRARVVIAAGLREIAAGDDAELRGEPLQQNRHQIGEQDHAEQRVAEPRAAGEIGGPVARVHVADRDQVARTGEGQQLAPEAGVCRDGDGAVDFGQAVRGRRQAPAFEGRRRGIFCGHRMSFDYSKSFKEYSTGVTGLPAPLHVTTRKEMWGARQYITWPAP